MLTTTNPFYWIGYYFGRNCVIHPDTGRWILAGFVDNDVYLRRNIGTPQEDCISYPIHEVQLILKRINPFLFKSVSNLNLFVKKYAMEGYWMNFDEKFTNQIVFEQ